MVEQFLRCHVHSILACDPDCLQRGLSSTREGFDAGDHPPVTPVCSATEQQLGGSDAWRLYELITRHFLATLAGPSRYLRRIACFDLNGEGFRYSAKKMIDPGFELMLRGQYLAPGALPDFRVGDALPLTRISVEVGII